MIGLALRFVIWLFAAIVVIGATVFLMVEAMDKAESIQKRAPWIPKILERRDAFVALLLICVVLLIGDGYELFTKEIPEASPLPPIVFKAPVAPIVAPPGGLRPFVEPSNSLRRRTMRLVKELNDFWTRRPTPSQMPVQNASTEEDRKRNALWDQYWRDAKAEYLNANYRERLVGIVREYKNKGVDVGYMEQTFDQPERLVGAAPFGGWQLDNCMQFMNELCQLRELAYHVDAHDQAIFLVAH